MTPLRRQTITFVVRVWVEYLNQENPCWRGEIEHPGTGGSLYFTDLSEMAEIIRHEAAASAAKNGQSLPLVDSESGA